MTQDFKRKTLVFMLIVLVLTLLLGSALPHLVFQQGLPPPRIQDGQVAVISPENANSIGMPVNGFFIALILITTLGVLIYGLYRLIRGFHWREILSSIFSILVIVLVLTGLLYVFLSRLPVENQTADALPIPTPEPVITAPLGPAPTYLIWLVAGGLLIAAVLIGVWLARSKPQAMPDGWGLEVERARDALLAGQDLRSVILQCYRRMSQTLQEEQQLEREVSMTAAEFELLLTAKGVPPDPVHQLTQLFESVRYGQWQPGPDDERNALRSLEEILEYSREAKPEA